MKTPSKQPVAVALVLALGWLHGCHARLLVDVFHAFQHPDAKQPLVAGRFRNLGDSAKLDVVGHVNMSLILKRDTSVFGQNYKELELVDGVLHTRRSGVPQCHYSGTVSGGGLVRASVCGGALKATARIGSELFEIKWLDEFQQHSISRVEESAVSLRAARDGVPIATGERRRTDETTACTPGDETAIKWVSIVAFNDAARYARRGTETEEQSGLIFGLVRDLYSGDNVPGMGLRGSGDVFNCDVRPRLVGQVTWRHSDPDELQYMRGDECAACGDSCREDEYSSSCLLNSFQSFLANWRADIEVLLGTSFDNAHLLTGVDLEGQLAGLAFVGSMCTDFSAAIESTQAHAGAAQTAALVAHELGHSLGLRHDDDNGPEYIMSATWSGASAATTSYRFSNASQQYAATYFAAQQTRLSCLDDAPASDDDAVWRGENFGSTLCGNGIVNENEECDPGIGLVDSCCRDDCLRDEACECSPSSACCDDSGSLRAAGEVCRNVQHATCDFVEQCDGLNEDCPIDMYESAGEECVSDVTGDNGKCYRGHCVARADNCAAYVTPDGQAAPLVCQQFSVCTMLYCSPNGQNCYSRGDPMLAGTSCGANSQCVETDYENTANIYAGVDEVECVESSSIKDYHWQVASDPCLQDPTCIDERGNPVQAFHCASNPPDTPGDCTEAPTASPAPSGTLDPSPAPSLPPTPRPTFTQTPTFAPTIPVSDNDNNGKSSGLVHRMLNLSFALRTAILVVLFSLLSCICILCVRPSLRSTIPNKSSRREIANRALRRQGSDGARPRATHTRNPASAERLHPPSNRRPIPTAPTAAIEPTVPHSAAPAALLQEEQNLQVAHALAAEDEQDSSHYFSLARAASPVHDPPSSPPRPTNSSGQDYRVSSFAVDV